VSAEPDAGPVRTYGGVVTGPSALGNDRRRFLHLSWTIATTEFKLRFFGSVLGYFWQLARPLLLFGVLYVVFTEFVKVGARVPYYPVVLLMNIVLFTFFQEATSGAVTSVVDRENLVRKIQFPRLAIPVAVVLTAGFNLCLNLIVVLVFALASGVDVRLTWLEMPLIVAVLVLLALGTAALVSALYVRFRDVKPIWDVVLQLLFYASPVIYALETIGQPKIQEWLALSPITAILQQMRHAVVDAGAPTAAQAAGGTARLLIPIGIVLLTAVTGFWVFNRQAPRIAEEL
jgi:ABC-2 type transport system permease protein